MRSLHCHWRRETSTQTRRIFRHVRLRSRSQIWILLSHSNLTKWWMLFILNLKKSRLHINNHSTKKTNQIHIQKPFTRSQMLRVKLRKRKECRKIRTWWELRLEIHQVMNVLVNLEAAILRIPISHLEMKAWTTKLTPSIAIIFRSPTI